MSKQNNIWNVCTHFQTWTIYFHGVHIKKNRLQGQTPHLLFEMTMKQEDGGAAPGAGLANLLYNFTATLNCYAGNCQRNIFKLLLEWKTVDDIQSNIKVRVICGEISIVWRPWPEAAVLSSTAQHHAASYMWPVGRAGFFNLSLLWRMQIFGVVGCLNELSPYWKSDKILQETQYQCPNWGTLFGRHPGVMAANIHNYQIIRLTRFPADNKLAIIN